MQLMLEGKAAGDHHEGTLEDPELLMEVRTVKGFGLCMATAAYGKKTGGGIGLFGWPAVSARRSGDLAVLLDRGERVISPTMVQHHGSACSCMPIGHVFCHRDVRGPYGEVRHRHWAVAQVARA